MNRKFVYSIVVILITAVSIYAMFYKGKGNFIESTGYEPETSNYIDYEDREYLGYIFNDYNKPVNLNYVDKVYKVYVDKGNTLNEVSLSAAGLENTRDNARAVRSERGIEQRALKEEVLKNSVVNTINAGERDEFDSNIGLDDRLELLNMMRNLSQSEIFQLKRLFDNQIGDAEVKNIFKMLKSKLQSDEYGKLSNMVNKYRLSPDSK